MKLSKFFKNRRKILGMNERNLIFIRKSNHKKAINIADDKILTKEILSFAGIPTSKLIAVINNIQELENFNWSTIPNTFVLKPATGLEGAGIDIFYNRDLNGEWIRADKTKVSLDNLKIQIRDILNGKYSLNQLPDRALWKSVV